MYALTLPKGGTNRRLLVFCHHPLLVSQQLIKFAYPANLYTGPQ